MWSGLLGRIGSLAGEEGRGSAKGSPCKIADEGITERPGLEEALALALLRHVGTLPGLCTAYRTEDILVVTGDVVVFFSDNRPSLGSLGI